MAEHGSRLSGLTEQEVFFEEQGLYIESIF